jgi:Na+-translocating ferredoxin:NAD+ oxidoreductase RnfG subunit
MVRVKFTAIWLTAVVFVSAAYLLVEPKIALRAQEEVEPFDLKAKAPSSFGGLSKSLLKEVMGQAERFEAVLNKNEILYYKVFDKNNNLIGAVFKARGKGYSSEIETLVGMNKDGTINAIKVLSQNERANQPWFQEQFNHKAISELDSINAITGATISCRAVIESVKDKAKEIKSLLDAK